MRSIESKFEQLGARAKVREVPARPVYRFADDPEFQIDVGSDRRGEFFDLVVPEGVELQVLNLRARERHLLLFVRSEEGKQRFLCGHDERHYFVAAVPDPVSTVEQAKDALKPPEARRARLRRRERGRRRTSAYVRQGEWFFIPSPGFNPGELPIHRKEPIQRSGGKPHICEELCRTGGEAVHVHDRHAPDGLPYKEYRALVRANPHLRGGWSQMRRDATVYVRGRVTHPDHTTVDLRGWHRVLPNTERRAPWARQVAFLD